MISIEMTDVLLRLNAIKAIGTSNFRHQQLVELLETLKKIQKRRPF